MLDIVDLAVAADNVSLLVDVLAQAIARVDLHVESPACRLLPVVDSSPKSSVRDDVVLFGVFVLVAGMVDVCSELAVVFVSDP